MVYIIIWSITTYINFVPLEDFCSIVAKVNCMTGQWKPDQKSNNVLQSVCKWMYVYIKHYIHIIDLISYRWIID